MAAKWNYTVQQEGNQASLSFENGSTSFGPIVMGRSQGVELIGLLQHAYGIEGGATATSQSRTVAGTSRAKKAGKRGGKSC
jgi:hypothetical protein